MELKGKEVEKLLIDKEFVSVQKKNNGFGIVSSIRYFQSYHGNINDKEIIVDFISENIYFFRMPYFDVGIEFSTIEELIRLFKNIR